MKQITKFLLGMGFIMFASTNIQAQGIETNGKLIVSEYHFENDHNGSGGGDGISSKGGGSDIGGFAHHGNEGGNGLISTRGGDNHVGGGGNGLCSSDKGNG